MRIQVESYSGYQADERPLRFYLGERTYQVKELLDRWRSPEGSYFRVRADDDQIYLLCHTRKSSASDWTVESAD